MAAALKAGGLASADQYLNELKLLHVEAGYSLEAWLARTFQLCKKSVVRERGPIRRAPEVDLDSLPAGGLGQRHSSGCASVRLGLCVGRGLDAQRSRALEGEVGTRHMEQGHQNGPLVHPPLEDGPEGAWRGKNATVLRGISLLEGLRLGHHSGPSRTSGSSCRASG